MTFGVSGGGGPKTAIFRVFRTFLEFFINLLNNGDSRTEARGAVSRVGVQCGFMEIHELKLAARIGQGSSIKTSKKGHFTRRNSQPNYIFLSDC